MATANRPRGKSAAARAAGDANLNALAEGLQRGSSARCGFSSGGTQSGRIEIDYYDDNDLTAVAEMLLGNARASMRA